MQTLTIFSTLLVLSMALGMFVRSLPILRTRSLISLISGSSWHPLQNEFGFLPFIAGTLWVTATAVVIAVPISLLASVYLTEYAHRYVRDVAKMMVDVLAGIPSVVFGVWGILIIVPFVKNSLAPALGTVSSGYTVLTAGIVLAVMIFPVIIHVIMEVVQAVPRELKEASLSLGATRWQTTKHVVLRRAFPGILAANILGLSRAFGETMAVLMVAGNVPLIPGSLLDPAYPLPALIANNYGEMMSIPMYDSALLLSALFLFTVVVGFNLISRIILVRVERRMG